LLPFATKPGLTKLHFPPRNVLAELPKQKET